MTAAPPRVVALAVGLGFALLGACARPSPVTPAQCAVVAEQEQRFDLARGFWAQAVALEPERTDWLLREGQSWLRGGQISTSEGLARLERVLAREPNNQVARSEVVDALLLLGDWASAAEHAARLPADDPNTYRRLARALLAGDPVAAAEAAERARALAPDDLGIQLLRAEIAERQGDLEAVEALTREVASREPSRVAALYLLGRTLLQTDRPEEGRRYLEAYAVVRRVVGDGNGGALAPLEELAALDQATALLGATTPDFELRRALALFRSGDTAKAETLARALAPQLAPTDVVELASNAYRAGRSGLCRDLLGAREGEPSVARAVVTSLAILDLDEGNPQTAEQRLGAFEANFDTAREPCGRCELLRGRAALQRGDRKTGLAHLRRAADLAPWSRDWVEELTTALGPEAQAETRTRREAVAAYEPE